MDRRTARLADLLARFPANKIDTLTEHHDPHAYEGRVLVGRITKPVELAPSRKVLLIYLEVVGGGGKELVLVRMYNAVRLGRVLAPDSPPPPPRPYDEASERKEILKEVQDMYPMGARVIVKEPSVAMLPFDLTNIHSPLGYHIFIENPFDFVVMEVDLPQAEGEKLREAGNAEYKNGNLWSALRIYTRCVHDDPRDVKSWGNRAQVNLLLRRNYFALCDAHRALALDPLSERNHHRKAQAETRLGMYEEAVTSLQRASECAAASTSSAEKNYDEEIARVMTLAEQKREGKYDWESLVFPVEKSGKPAKKVPAIADYVGPVRVEKAPGDACGRRLVVSRPVEAGELLFVCNPLVCVEIARESSLLTHVNALHAAIQNELLRAAAADPTLCARVLNKVGDGVNAMTADVDLSALAYVSVPSNADERDAQEAQEPYLSTDQLQRQVKLNSFNKGAGTGNDASSPARAGFFPITLFCNHSCVPTASMLYVGRAQVVRAGRAMREGEEVTIRYFPTQGETLAQRREVSTKTWGFSCACRLCRLESSLLGDEKGSFKALFEKVQSTLAGSQGNSREVVEARTKEVEAFLETSIVPEEGESLEERRALGRALFIHLYLHRMGLTDASQSGKRGGGASERAAVTSIMAAIEPSSYEHCKLCTIALVRGDDETTSGGREAPLEMWRRVAFKGRYGGEPGGWWKSGEPPQISAPDAPPCYAQRLLDRLTSDAKTRAARFDWCNEFMG